MTSEPEGVYLGGWLVVEHGGKVIVTDVQTGDSYAASEDPNNIASFVLARFARHIANDFAAHPTPPQQAPMDRTPERDWTEDESHENGRYECICCECYLPFVGHKRRVICKVCAEKSKPLSPPEPTTHPEQRRVSPVAESHASPSQGDEAGVAPRQADTAPDTEELAKRLEESAAKGSKWNPGGNWRLLEQAAERLRQQAKELGPWRLIGDGHWQCAECKYYVYRGSYPTWFGHGDACSHSVHPIIERAESAERANAAMREDAERYRWLRTESWEEHGIVAPYDDGCNNIVGPELDALIDAALSRKDGRNGT